MRRADAQDVPRPPLLVVVVLVAVGLLPPIAASARPGGKVRPVLPGATHGDKFPAGADRILRVQLKRARRVTKAKFGAASAGGLADGAWCGAERATDDTTYAATTGPRIKVIYAYPSDRPNRFSTMRDLIQADARDMTDIVLAASSNTKTLRFDVGTVCGAGYLDIISVKLPRTSAQYRQVNASSRMSMLTSDLASSVSGMTGKRNFLVYADATSAGDGVAGIGSMFLDDRPGSDNPANAGNLWAVAFGNGSDPDFSGGRLTTVLHEVSHNLGAVQDSAPNSTGAGHCTDEQDVMCYDDGGPTSTMSNPCAVQAYDCGQNDYFNPAPTGGSYLATHWNVHRSVFLCAPSACVGSSVGGGNPAPVANIAVRDLGGAATTTVTAGGRLVLDASGSSDDESVAEYAWDVGADGSVESRAASFVAAFSSAGIVPVKLTVRDGYGASATATTSIQVAAPAAAPPVTTTRPTTGNADDRGRRQISSALRASLTRLKGALRDAQRSARLKVRFTAPQAGWLVASVTANGRKVAAASWSVKGGRSEQFTARLSRKARARLAKGGKVALRLEFYGADGGSTVARQSLKLPRR